MLKKIIATSLVATALLFSGCGDGDTAGEDSLAAQHAIDKGNSDLAISLILNGKSLDEALANMSDDDKITLASAYMGQAGLGMTDIVAAAMSDKDAKDKFKSFKSGIEAKANSNSLSSVDNAITCYNATTLNAAPSKRGNGLGAENIQDKDVKITLAYLSKAILYLSAKKDDGTLLKSNNEIATFLVDEVFSLVEKLDSLKDLQDEVEKVKTDIADNAAPLDKITGDDIQEYRL